MIAAHPDDFRLLVYLEGELDELEAARLKRHLAECPACAAACRDIERLDRTLKSTLPDLEDALAEPLLPEGDPFRRRPDGIPLGAARPAGPAEIPEVLVASREAIEVKSRLLDAAAAPEEDLRSTLEALDLLGLRDRYGLGYALDEALYGMVDGPSRWDRFGHLSVDRVLSARADARALDAPAERAYPLDDLLGLSLLVSGTACNWTGEFLRGGRDLRRAYGAFARGSVSERRLASVELAEAQRRAFLDRAAEALHLADRARLTFQALGMEDEAARAAGAKALALSYLGRDEEAVAEFRSILAVLASHERWNTYVSALNGIGVCLTNLGRVDEARREYARALRQVSVSARVAVHGFLRANLARTLFRAGRWAEAARAFAGARSSFESHEARADAFQVDLYRIECLARLGSVAEAREALARFSDRVHREGAVDQSVLQSLELALTGGDPDLDRLASLRSEAEDQIATRLRRAV